MRILHWDATTEEEIRTALQQRAPMSYTEQEERVAQILKDVREQGDMALFSYTARFDGAALTAANVEVPPEEIREARQAVEPAFLDVLHQAAANIRAFHERQRQESWIAPMGEGIRLGLQVTPMARAGVYVPGGKAAYPSSVLMNIIPAKVAGVDEIIMTTPCDADGRITPTTLAAAAEAGADRIFKVGGAQAIAAMAYGTESIPRVDKIVGPGNIYVALAKRAVFGHVSIDAVAGPSEILVLADESANPRFVAADLLSQAEHDEMASAMLVTTSAELAERVSEEVDRILPTLSRRAIIEQSLEHYGRILIVPDLDTGIEVVNTIASEHLEILTEDPQAVLPRIRNAGAIFLGSYSCEPLGDYFAGPNHVLPTNGTARFFSPLSVDDFIKKSSVISYSRDALRAVYPDIAYFADQEQLTAHANAIRTRFEEEDNE